MNKIKTIRKQMTWTGREGRVRIAAYQFERVRVFNVGGDWETEGPMFVNHAIVVNVGGQPGVWLSPKDVAYLKELLSQLEMDSGDVADDDRHKPTGAGPAVQVVLDTDGRAAAEHEKRVREATLKHDRECLARNMDVLAAAERLAEKEAEREAENEAEDDSGEDAEEERGERQRLIQTTLWHGFEPLQSLPDTRKLPDVVKAENPVSAMALTQWCNYSDLPQTA